MGVADLLLLGLLDATRRDGAIVIFKIPLARINFQPSGGPIPILLFSLRVRTHRFLIFYQDLARA